jgi:hypothetical protein
VPTLRTRTIKTAGGDYTSLAGWEAGEEGNLVTLDEIRRASIFAYTETTYLELAGWTTDNTRYPELIVDPTARHTGKFTTGAFRFEPTSATPGIDAWDCNQYRVVGWQLKNTQTVATQLIRHAATANGAWVESIGNLLWAGAAPVSGMHGVSIDANDFTHTSRVRNTIIIDQYDGIYLRNGGLAARNLIGYNITVLDPGFFGIIVDTDASSQGVIRLKNNLIQGASTNYFLGTMSATDFATNISEDATSPTVALRSKVATFVDETGSDLHLSSSDTVAKDAGTDLSADANWAFSDDIDGATRAGTWDIGADEITAAGSPPMFRAFA